MDLLSHILKKDFGSLAAMSDITYAHFYTGYNSTLERRKSNRNGQTREWARRRNMCLNLDAVIEGVRDMINKWKKCCDVPPRSLV